MAFDSSANPPPSPWRRSPARDSSPAIQSTLGPSPTHGRRDPAPFGAPLGSQSHTTWYTPPANFPLRPAPAPRADRAPPDTPHETRIQPRRMPRDRQREIGCSQGRRPSRSRPRCSRAASAYQGGCEPSHKRPSSPASAPYRGLSVPGRDARAPFAAGSSLPARPSFFPCPH